MLAGAEVHGMRIEGLLMTHAVLFLDGKPALPNVPHFYPCISQS